MEKNRDIERLRAFAVLFVVVAHISWIQAAVARQAALRLVPWTGVDLFFVISGFVVSAAFERDIRRFASQRMPRFRAVLAFATKRAARILPTAFACIALWWTAWMFLNSGGFFGKPWSNERALAIVAANALFFSNYAMAYKLVPSQLGWFWSLCVEEHFYLLYPAFRLTFEAIRRRVRLLLAVVLVTVVVFRNLSSDPAAIQQLSHMRFDQLALGVLLQIAWQQFRGGFEHLRAGFVSSAGARSAARVVMVALLVVLAAVPTMLVPDPEFYRPGSDAMHMRISLLVTSGLAFALVALASFNLDLLSFGVKPLGAALVAIGARSYAIYMYHIPAQWVSQELVHRNPQLLSVNDPDRSMITIYLIVLVLLVEANYRLIEQPFIVIGKRRVARLDEERRPAGPMPLFPWLPSRRTVAVALAAAVVVSLTGIAVLEARLRSVLAAPLAGDVAPVPAASEADALVTLKRGGIDGVGPVDRGRLLHAGGSLLPVGGVAGRVTLLCRRSGRWLTRETDAFGFLNPAGTHDMTTADYVLLGDEDIACAAAHDSIAGLMRGRGAGVLDLTLPGHGPLQELAALREYGLRVRPRRIVWFMSERTDITDFAAEQDSPLLLEYLAPGFSQRLTERQADIDRLIDPAAGAPDARPAAAGRALPAAGWSRWGYIPAVRQWWETPGAIDTRADWFQSALAQPPVAAGPEDPPIPEQARFSAALERARDDAASIGAALLVVILPEHRRFTDPGYSESHRPQILRLAAAASVPALDVVEVFKRAPSPPSLFDRTSGMYSAAGFRVIHAAVSARAERLP